MKRFRNLFQTIKSRKQYIGFYSVILAFVFAYGTNCNSTTPFSYVKDAGNTKVASEDFLFETINEAEAGIKSMAEYSYDSYLSNLNENMASSVDRIKNLIFDLQMPTNSNDVLKLYTKLVDLLSKMRDRINFLVLQGQIDKIFGDVKNLQAQVARIEEVIPALEKRIMEYVVTADQTLEAKIDATNKELQRVEAEGDQALASHIEQYLQDQAQLQANLKAVKDRAEEGVALADQAIDLYHKLNGVVTQQGTELAAFKNDFNVLVASVSKTTDENNKFFTQINQELASLKNAGSTTYQASIADWKCSQDLDLRNGIELMLGEKKATFEEFVADYQTNVSEACTRNKELLLYNMCAMKYPTFCGNCLDSSGKPVPPANCESWTSKSAAERLNILINLRQDIAIHFLNQRTEVQGLAIWGGKQCNVSCLEAPAGVPDDMIKSMLGNISSNSDVACTEDSWKACGLFGAVYSLGKKDRELEAKINKVQADSAAQLASLRTDFENEKVRAAQALNMTKLELEQKIATLDDKTKERIGAITNALGGKISSIAGQDQSFANEIDEAAKRLYALQASVISLRESAFPTALSSMVGFQAKTADAINAIFMQDRDALLDNLANMPQLLNDVDMEFMKALVSAGLADQNSLPFYDASLKSAVGTLCGPIDSTPFARVVGRDSFRLLGIAYIKSLANGTRSASDSNNRIFFSGQYDNSDFVGSAILSQALTAYMLDYDGMEAKPTAACIGAIDQWAKGVLLDGESTNHSALRSAISSSLTLPRAVESLRIAYQGLKNRVTSIELKVRAMAVDEMQVPEDEAKLNKQLMSLAIVLAKAGREKFSSEEARRRFDGLVELARSLSPATDSWQMEFNASLKQINLNLTSFYQDVSAMKTTMNNIIPYVAFAANADSRVAGTSILQKVNLAKASLDANIIAQVNAAIVTANYTPGLTSIRHILPNYTTYDLNSGAVGTSCTSGMNNIVFEENTSKGYISGPNLCWVNFRNGSMEANKHTMILRLWGTFDRIKVRAAGANNCAAGTTYTLDMATVNTPASRYDLLSPATHRTIFAAKADTSTPKGRYDVQVPRLFDPYYYGGACMEATNWQRANFFTVTPIRMEASGTEVAGTTLGYRTTLYSPVVLDFVNKGMIQTLSQDSEVKFDLTGDGKALNTGWVSGHQGGLLGLDINGNGQVDDGTELFGQFTRLPNGKLAENGYEALKQYDDNRDGYIDSKDAIYSKVIVWFDNNRNGVSEPKEMKSLAQVEVTKIALSYKEVPSQQQWDNGNLIKYQAKFFGPKQCSKSGCNSYDVFFDTGHIVENPSIAKK